MSVVTYTKSGSKSTTPAKLDKKVFGLEVANHDLMQRAYLSYLATGRINLAKTKKRGQVSGGGAKPWRQKGTGKARFGSSRNPIWRGGGVAFGPTGGENYDLKLNIQAKRQALKQALSLAAKEERIKVIENFMADEGKAKPMKVLLEKLDSAGRRTLLVVDSKEPLLRRATANLSGVTLTTAGYLNIFDVLNADQIVFTKPGLEKTHERLGGAK